LTETWHPALLISGFLKFICSSGIISWWHQHILLRCQTVSATGVKMFVFWALEPGSLVETDQRCVLPSSSSWLLVLMMGAVSTCETSVSFYQTTHCNIPEGNHLHRLGSLFRSREC
jgi:hypothetical protein